MGRGSSTASGDYGLSAVTARSTPAKTIALVADMRLDETIDMNTCMEMGEALREGVLSSTRAVLGSGNKLIVVGDCPMTRGMVEMIRDEYPDAPDPEFVSEFDNFKGSVNGAIVAGEIDPAELKIVTDAAPKVGCLVETMPPDLRSNPEVKTTTLDSPEGMLTYPFVAQLAVEEW